MESVTGNENRKGPNTTTSGSLPRQSVTSPQQRERRLRYWSATQLTTDLVVAATDPAVPPATMSETEAMGRMVINDALRVPPQQRQTS